MGLLDIVPVSALVVLAFLMRRADRSQGWRLDWRQCPETLRVRQGTRGAFELPIFTRHASLLTAYV